MSIILFNENLKKSTANTNLHKYYMHLKIKRNHNVRKKLNNCAKPFDDKFNVALSRLALLFSAYPTSFECQISNCSKQIMISTDPVPWLLKL